MKNKKVAAILMTMAMAVSLAACGTQATNVDSDPTEIAETVESEETSEEVETETVESEVEETEAEGEETEAEMEAEGEETKYTWRETTAERGIYDLYGEERCGQYYCEETLDEVLQMYEDPSLEMADWDQFFKRTYFQGCDLDDLLWLQENGYTFEEVGQMIRDTQNTANECWTLKALGLLPEE